MWDKSRKKRPCTRQTWFSCSSHPWHSTLILLLSWRLVFSCFFVSPVISCEFDWLEELEGGWRWGGQTGEENMKRSREEEDDTELGCWQMCWAHCCSAQTRWHEKMERRSVKECGSGNVQEGRRKRDGGLTPSVPSVCSLICHLIKVTNVLRSWEELVKFYSFSLLFNFKALITTLN